MEEELDQKGRQLFFAACISQDRLLGCDNKHSPSVSNRNNAGLVLAYSTYPLVEGSGSCWLYSEAPAAGGSCVWNFMDLSSGNRVWRTTHGFFSTSAKKKTKKEKRHTHHFCSILLARTSLRAEANLRSERQESVIVPNTRKRNWIAVNSGNIFFTFTSQQTHAHTYRPLTPSPIVKLAPKAK